jgi:hypothetical protein
MQTFLPTQCLNLDFTPIGKILDRKRLNKQITEAKQIHNILIKQAPLTKNNKVAWENHPAVLMWKTSEDLLAKYHNDLFDVWESIGGKNIKRVKIPYANSYACQIPFWFYDERIYSSHRSALLFKDLEYYEKFGWIEKAELNYYWPVQKNAS